MKQGAAQAALRERSRRVRRVFWAIGAFFALGYFPTVFLGSPVISMAAAACVAVPYGSGCGGARKGAVRGGLLGAVAGLAMAGALFGLLARLYGPPATTRPASRPTAVTRPATAPASQPNGTGPRKRGPIDFWGLAAPTVGGSVLLCAIAGAAAAHLGQRRRKMIEQQWQE